MMISNGPLHYLSRNNGKKLAYRLREGADSFPTLVFLGGYRSDMTGTKAAFLDHFCAQHTYRFLRFDYSGHGASDGDFRDGCIGDWAQDALTVIKATVKGDMILIGSSMGGWIGLLATQQLGHHVKGFIGIAAAPDFTHHVWHHEMTPAQRDLCTKQGYITTPDGDTLTLKLLQEGEQHLIFNSPLPMTCPIILLQGKLDNIVPYQTAQKLADHITSPTPPEVILINDGDHRLARDEDLELLSSHVERMLKKTIPEIL